MMTGGNTTGGIAGSLARTVLDTAPYEIPADDPTLQTDMDAKLLFIAGGMTMMI